MKKFLAVILAVALLFVFSACGGEEPAPAPDDEQEITEDDTTENDTTEEDTTDKTVSQVMELNILATVSETGKKELDRFTDLSEEYSNGTVVCNVTYPAEVDDRDMPELLMSGEYDVIIGHAQAFAYEIKDLYLFDACYLFRSKDEVKNSGLKGKAFSTLEESFEEQGLKLLSLWDNGFRQLISAEKEVHGPKTLKGLTIDTNNDKVHKAVWKSLGAKTAHVDAEEELTALQEKSIDGLEASYETMISGSYQSAAAYLVKTNHSYDPLIVVMKLDKFNSMNELQSSAVLQAMEAAGSKSFSESDSYEEYALKEFEKAGTVTVIPTEKQMAAYIKKTNSDDVLAKIKSKMSHPEILDTMMSELESYRKAHAVDTQN